MLEKLFYPQSVAIIGAAREEGKVGHVILDNIRNSGYKGDLYLVNPKAKQIHGIKSYASILDIEKNVDVVVIVTPAKTIPEIIEQSGKRKVKYAIVISAGFKETDINGAKLEKRMIEVAKKYGIRVLGPNGLGLINAEIGLNASFTRVGPLKGSIAFVSQSGALQTAVLDWSRESGLGFSKFVSLGNKADLDEVDFIEALSKDEKTSVICLYLEGVTNGSKFLEVASKVALQKPLIALKAGRSIAGARAVSSHTGSLAGSRNAYKAAFTQAGIIQAESLRQLFAFATALSLQPLPKGNKMAVLTNAGGPAILASDFASSSALSVASLSSKTTTKLSEFLPPAANVYNPVDLLGDARSDRYEKALDILIKDRNVDNLLVILTPQAMSELDETANLVTKAASKTKKPIIASFMGGVEIKNPEKILTKKGVPNYIYPEDAVKAMGALLTYGKIKKRPKAKFKKYNINNSNVKEIINKARKEERVNLSYLEASEILKTYKINVPENSLAKTEKEGASFARKIGYPVALKIISSEILHKTDIGGVKLNIENEKQLIEAFREILTNVRKYMPQAGIQGILVQEMVSLGEETIVGMSRDPQFGPLILFGLGGIYVEILKDVSFRIAPLSTMDVKIMLSEVKSYLLLKGIRGSRARDVAALEDSILRISQMVIKNSEIVEMDLNPLMVKDEGRGVVAADVRMSISLK